MALDDAIAPPLRAGAAAATARPRTGRLDALAVATLVLLVFSVLFGGASREHAVRLALVELAAVPVLLLAGGRLISTGVWREARLPLAVVATVAAVPLVQLVPLPFDLWRQLPGRAPVAEAMDLAGVPIGWRPLSLAAEATWRSLLALLPPAAAFLAVLLIPLDQRRRLAGLCLVAALFGVALGAAQVLGGAFYPYQTTNHGSPVGLFANRNHLAALLVAVLPLAGVLAGEATARGRRGTTVLLTAAGYLLILVGLGAIRSRAGVLLAGPALVASLLLVWRAQPGRRLNRTVLATAAAGLVAVTAVAAFGLDPVLQRFDAGRAEARFETWPLILKTAEAHLPLGAGVGAFDPVYRSVEPLETMGPAYLNHAHNEYLELWLEAGWLAAAAFVLFLAWLARAARAAWSGGEDRQLARAAVVSVGMLLLHSAVDYPLRTETLAVFFAVLCGFACRPLPLARP